VQEEVVMDFFFSIVGFFVTGGPFMYPILIVFAVGTAIAVERYITLNLVTTQNQSSWSKLQPTLVQGDFEKAREMTSKDESTVAKLLSMGLARQGAVRRREDIEIAMEESMMEIIPQLEKRTPYVALMVAIPLLITHTILTAKTGEIVDSLEMASVKALNVISAKAKRQVEV
jgi:biopolymer transport protein ExbB